jgi:hypothetical protein
MEAPKGKAAEIKELARRKAFLDGWLASNPSSVADFNQNWLERENIRKRMGEA